jgi:hypothetical protein
VVEADPWLPLVDVTKAGCSLTRRFCLLPSAMRKQTLWCSRETISQEFCKRQELEGADASG